MIRRLSAMISALFGVNTWRQKTETRHGTVATIGVGRPGSAKMCQRSFSSPPQDTPRLRLAWKIMEKDNHLFVRGKCILPGPCSTSMMMSRSAALCIKRCACYYWLKEPLHGMACSLHSCDVPLRPTSRRRRAHLAGRLELSLTRAFP